jgi:hypothetical protein
MVIHDLDSGINEMEVRNLKLPTETDNYLLLI